MSEGTRGHLTSAAANNRRSGPSWRHARLLLLLGALRCRWLFYEQLPRSRKDSSLALVIEQSRFGLRGAGELTKAKTLPRDWQHLEHQLHDRRRWTGDGVVLGHGSFGVVARGVDEKTGELVAIKHIAPKHQLAIATARNEIEAAQKVGEHPNILPMKAWFLEEVQGEEEPALAARLIYPVASGGTLQQWIAKRHGSSFDVDYSKPQLTMEALRLMGKLLDGLSHIHSKNIQHRDIKPTNILLGDRGEPLIADFGIALVNTSSELVKSTGVVGDFYFIDMDSLVNGGLPYHLKDDIYSMGEVFVRILYGPYARGAELQRFVEDLEYPSELPEVVQAVNGMLLERQHRWSLSRVAETLQNMEMEFFLAVMRD